jgi:hypothetical protein
VPLAGFHYDVAAAASVAAGRSAALNKLLPAKRHAAVPAVAGFYANFGFVDEHQLLAASCWLLAKNKGKINGLTADFTDKRGSHGLNRNAKKQSIIREIRADPCDPW